MIIQSGHFWILPPKLIIFLDRSGADTMHYMGITEINLLNCPNFFKTPHLEAMYQMHHFVRYLYLDGNMGAILPCIL